MPRLAPQTILKIVVTLKGQLFDAIMVRIFYISELVATKGEEISHIKRAEGGEARHYLAVDAN